jgi:uncharacterized protein (TIGR02118 family)
MSTIVVLFNLKPGVDRNEYEEWARTVDIPSVRRLDGCSGFNVLRSERLLDGSTDVPYAYVELIHVDDMTDFMSAVSAPAAQEVAAQFREFAEGATFMVTESIE